MSPDEAQAELPAKPRRNPRHERNFGRLLDAAVEILLGEGMAGFTSARIAQAAGLHKPAFYAHFKNVDECLKAVALRVAGADLQSSLALHGKTLESLPTGGRPSDAYVEQTTRAIHQELQNAKEHARLYRLIARYRHDDSALGPAIRDIDRYTLERWTEYFWRMAVHYGIDAQHFKEVAELAEHIVGITLNAIERIVMGRVTDTQVEAERIYRYSSAIVTAEFRRMLGL